MRIDYEDLFRFTEDDPRELISIVSDTHPDRQNRTGFWLFAEQFDKTPAYYTFGSNSPWNPTYIVYLDFDDEPCAMISYRLKDVHVENTAHIMGVQVLNEYQGNGFAKEIIKETIDIIHEKYPELIGVTVQPYVPSLIDFYKKLGFVQYNNRTDLMIKYY